MVEQHAEREPFAVKDCALVAIALGNKAQNLREMLVHLRSIHPGSLYYHFWGRLLRSQFAYPEYYNDFAGWVHYSLHDDTLAERLAIFGSHQLHRLGIAPTEIGRSGGRKARRS